MGEGLRGGGGGVFFRRSGGGGGAGFAGTRRTGWGGRSGKEHLSRRWRERGGNKEGVGVSGGAIGELARRGGMGFADWFGMIQVGTKKTPPRALTDDGIHYTRYGAYRFGKAM